jgi:hypothetical protein
MSGAPVAPEVVRSTVIATIYKNRSEEVRVTLNEYDGHELISLWVWFDGIDGEQRPGKGGLTMRASAIPELICALQDAEIEAKRRKWISGVTAQ